MSQRGRFRRVKKFILRSQKEKDRRFEQIMSADKVVYEVGFKKLIEFPPQLKRVVHVVGGGNRDSRRKLK